MEIWQDHVRIEGSPSIFLEVRTPWALLFSGILRKFRWFFLMCSTFNSDFKIFFRCSFTAPSSQIPWMESLNHRIDWWLFDDHLIGGHHRNNIIKSYHKSSLLGFSTKLSLKIYEKPRSMLLSSTPSRWTVRLRKQQTWCGWKEPSKTNSKSQGICHLMSQGIHPWK